MCAFLLMQGRVKEQLELERRKAIGEVVQLNPYFKPPTGWRPVLEEAKLFIPVGRRQTARFRFVRTGIVRRSIMSLECAQTIHEQDNKALNRNTRPGMHKISAGNAPHHYHLFKRQVFLVTFRGSKTYLNEL